LSEKRWEHDEWRRFELWERIELRLRRNRRLVYAAAFVVFLGLSSTPIWMDRSPAYRALRGARELSELLNQVKLEVARTRQAVRLVLSSEPGLGWEMERLASGCASSGEGAVGAGSEPFRRGSLLAETESSSLFKFLSEAEGSALGIPGLLLEFCYDPIEGDFLAARGRKLAGFAVAPVVDLTALRIDRIATVVIRGHSADPRFE